jgi:alginate O-acetyltransferase complex protein AlgI
MLFNSISFGIFLPIVFVLYWFFTRGVLRFQNILLLVSSYYFYASWDYRFLFLLIFSTLLDYFTGIKIFEAEKKGIRKIWFWLSISINLGFLGFFKYYNFFANSFGALLSSFGLHVDVWIINIILPIGISFYTFHGLSYIIDIYNNRIEPERNFIDYSVFVCFFPLLVAGPIERATHLLPQIKKERFFDYSKAVDGLRQILWGLFKKIVIADNCAEYVNTIFGNMSEHSGSTLALAAILFTYQIYCDFSGYSDIALGTARLFGIELLHNFWFPYFSKSITEFWRRWHISLSTWFNDYLFTPIVTDLRNWGKWAVSIGIMITFFLSGLWHGAGWNFVIYGCLHGAAITYEFLTKKYRKKLLNILPPALSSLILQTMVFAFVTIGFLFFRSKDITHAFTYLLRILSSSILDQPYITAKTYIVMVLIFLFMLVERIGRNGKYAIESIGVRWPRLMKWSFYSLIILLILCFHGKEQEFIYFQF